MLLRLFLFTYRRKSNKIITKQKKICYSTCGTGNFLGSRFKDKNRSVAWHVYWVGGSLRGRGTHLSRSQKGICRRPRDLQTRSSGVCFGKVAWKAAKACPPTTWWRGRPTTPTPVGLFLRPFRFSGLRTTQRNQSNLETFVPRQKPGGPHPHPICELLSRPGACASQTPLHSPSTSLPRPRPARSPPSLA